MHPVAAQSIPRLAPACHYTALLALLLVGCAPCGAAPGTQLPLWGSDGCSSSPDLGPAVVCCDRHDHHYRTGGPLGTWTERQRRASDLYLLACLTQFENVISSFDARIYFEGVRLGGIGSWERNRAIAGGLRMSR